MLVNPRGHLIPSSEIVARLKQIDPDLGMIYLPVAKCFALAYAWPQNDPRRELIRRGAASEDSAYDVWGYAPPNVTVEDAFHCLVAGLRENRGNESAKRLLDRVHEYNKKQEDLNAQPTMDYLDEMLEYNAPHLFEDTLGKRTIRHYVTNPKAGER